MTAREVCLRHYSQSNTPVCAWCGSQTHLELDHIRGQGNQHRRDIQTKLATWLRSHGFPPIIQVLCHDCHVRKTQEGGFMARTSDGEEKTAKNFYLRKDVITQLDTLAKAKGIAPSQLIEDWTIATTDGNSDLSPKLLSMLHQRHTELTAAVEILTTQMATLTKQMMRLQSDQEVVQREIKNLDSGPLTRIIDVVLKIDAWTQRGWLKR